jgi:hypothetical protein
MLADSGTTNVTFGDAMKNRIEDGMRMGGKRRMGAASILIGALALALTLTACASAPGPSIPQNAKTEGQTLAEMQAAVAVIPGIAVLEADGGGPPNIKDNTGYSFTLRLDPAYEVADGPALVEFFARSAWSVREGYLPNATIDITVLSDKTRPFDVRAAAEQSGWATHWPVEPHEGSSTISIMTYTDKAQGGEENAVQGRKSRDRLGPWPGPVPAVPAGITAERP